MSNKTKNTIYLMCSMVWLVVSSMNFASGYFGLGILNLVIALSNAFIFSTNLNYNEDMEEEAMLEIERYEYNYRDNDYLIYLIENEEDESITDFYIQKKGNGNISHTIGLNIDNLEIEIDEFINNNLEEWVKICLLDIEKLEN